MMNSLKFKGAIFGLLLFTACQNNPHENEIATVEGLKSQLDSAAAVFSKIDTAGYQEFSRKYKRNVAFIQQKLTAKGDTIDRATALLMADYRELKKPYSQFKLKYEQAEKELEFSENQLITLKHDLKNNSMDTVVSKHMLSDEIEATESIISTIGHLNIMNTNTRKKTAKMEPKIDSLITVLKQY